MSIVLRLVRLDHSGDDGTERKPVVTFVGDSDPEVYAKLDEYMKTEMVSPRLYLSGDALYPQFRVEREHAR